MLIKIFFAALVLGVLTYMAVAGLQLGKVSFELYGLSTQTNIPGLLLLFAVVYLAIILTVKVMNMPRWFKGMWARRARRVFDEALADMLAGRMLEARKKFLRAAVEPDVHNARALSAYCSVRAGDVAGARAAAYKAVDLRPRDEAALLMRAFVDLADGDDGAADAKPTLKRLYENSPDNMEVGAMLLRCCLRGGDVETVKEVLPGMLRDLPATGGVRPIVQAAARLLMERGDADERDAVWERADQGMQDELLADYARALDGADETKRAQKLLARAIESMVGGGEEARVDVFAAYGGLRGEGLEARLDAARKWREAAPEFVPASLALGMIYRRLRMYDKALECLEFCFARQSLPQAAREIALTLADKKGRDGGTDVV